MSVIGIVRLAPGQVGYFDDLTRIHLTIASPEKPVVSGMNTANLKRAVRSGRILLSSGSLDVAAVKAPVQEAPVKVEVQTQTPVESAEIKEESGVVTVDTEAALQKIQEEKEEAATITKEFVEEPVVEEPIAEAVVETAEEVVVTAEETVVEDTEVEAEVATEVEVEVTEEATETTETEVKAAAKKGSTKKK